MSIGHRLALVATAAAEIVVVAATAPNYPLSANILLVLLMVVAGVFVGRYAFWSNWRATAAGRAIMGLIACLTVICGIGTLGFFLGNYPGRPFVRAAAFCAVTFTVMNLLLTLVAAQRETDREDS